MEKWKIGVIAALLAGLVGFGVYQQKATEAPPEKSSADATPTPSPYQGKEIGKQLPEWKEINQWMNTPQPIPLTSLKGSVALVEVFRIQCPHCQDAAPLMEKLYERYQPLGLKMVAIQSPGDYQNLENPENDWDAVKSWAKTRNLKYPLGFDFDSQWFQGKLHGELYPTILVFDRSGKVVLSFSGHDNKKFMNLVTTLDKLIVTKGSVDQRAKDLAKWLNNLLQTGPEKNDPILLKAMSDDIAQSLK